MKTIYRITPSGDAPELIIEQGISNNLDGKPIADRWPNEPFKGEVAKICDWRQFYRVGKNGFALSEAVWEECEDMYYTITENYIELLSVMAGGFDLRVIYALDVLKASNVPTELCDLTYASSLFRIEGQPMEQVFCLEGMTQGNEFKQFYDLYGFKGLKFEEVWSEPTKH